MYLSTKSANKRTFKTVPPGSHLGRLYRIVDIGTQQGTWQDKIIQQRKLIFHFELHGEDMQGAPLTTDEGKPLIVTKYYNRSLNEKSTLRKHLQAWLNIDFDKLEEGFDVKSLLGKFVMLGITNYVDKKGETRASVESLSPIPSIIQKAGLPEGVNPLFLFDLDKFDSEKYESLSDGIKGLIQNSPEYRKIAQRGYEPAKQADDEYNDDIPF